MALTPLMKRMISVLHALQPGGTSLETIPFGDFCSLLSVWWGLSIIHVKWIKC